MKRLNQYLVGKWGRNEDGTTAIEYAFIAAGIGLALAAAAPLLGIAVGGKFNLVTSWFP